MKVYFNELNGFAVIEEIINVTHDHRVNHLGKEKLIFTTQEGRRITTEIENKDVIVNYLKDLFECNNVKVNEHSYYTLG